MDSSHPNAFKNAPISPLFSAESSHSSAAFLQESSAARVPDPREEKFDVLFGSTISESEFNSRIYTVRTDMLLGTPIS
jgi:hypothetical protein